MELFWPLLIPQICGKDLTQGRIIPVVLFTHLGGSRGKLCRPYSRNIETSIVWGHSIPISGVKTGSAGSLIEEKIGVFFQGLPDPARNYPTANSSIGSQWGLDLPPSAKSRLRKARV